MDIQPNVNEDQSNPSQDGGFRSNPSKKPKIIRGVSAKKYAEYMHSVERGDTTEAALVRKKLLLPGRGIAANRDDHVFNIRSKIRGKNKPGICTIPSCNNARSRRGLCNTHRTYYKRMKRLGKANETNLINRGLLLPLDGKRNPSRKVKNLPIRRESNISKLFSAKHCLHPKCNEKRAKRGLCKRHHRLYLKSRSALSPQKRDELEQDLIKRRLLLPKIDVAAQSEANAFQLGSKIKGIVHKS